MKEEERLLWYPFPQASAPMGIKDGDEEVEESEDVEEQSKSLYSVGGRGGGREKGKERGGLEWKEKKKNPPPPPGEEEKELRGDDEMKVEEEEEAQEEEVVSCARLPTSINPSMVRAAVVRRRGRQ